MITLGFDTSNYTTSVAWFDGTTGENYGRLLDVRDGTLGLRQSEALFQHVKYIPELVDKLCFPENSRIAAVGASTQPRAVEGSYMPCFLAGASQARVLAKSMNIPFKSFSHQQGHLAAVLWSAEHMELAEKPMLAWHLSGGTTELLYVKPGFLAHRIGGTEDLTAGQLIDRTGVLLGYNFPAGKTLDALADGINIKPFRVKNRGLCFSLSGIENQVKKQAADKVDKAEIAAYVLETIADVIYRTTISALQQYGDIPIVFTGGVSSNRCLRRTMAQVNSVFGTPACSTDNAMGIAVLTWIMEKHHG